MYTIPYTIIDWSLLASTESKGTTGQSLSQLIDLDGLRLRIVEYSEGYLADHWCSKGHIVYCLDGKFETELSDGRKIVLTKGMSYVVSDELSSHRSYSKDGVKLLVIDGDFLKPQKN